MDRKDTVLELVYQCGDLTEHGLSMMMRFAEKWQITGFEALLECRVVSEERVAEIIANRLGYESVDLSALLTTPVDPKLLAKLPYKEARRYRCIPVCWDEASGILSCAMADPTNAAVIGALENIVAAKLQLVVARRSHIDEALGEMYPALDQLTMISEVKV